MGGGAVNSGIRPLIDNLQSKGFSVLLVGGVVKVQGDGPPDQDAAKLLDELRDRKDEVKAVLSPEADPILPVNRWLPVFTTLHHAVVRETPDFDYAELRRQNPDLYAKIKDAENSIDSLNDARLSKVVLLVGEWCELVLAAYFEKRDTHGKIA
jgi:hypothetical protein